MGVGVLHLRRSMVLAVPVAAAIALLASLAIGNPPHSPGGIFPVPGMGPPGAVAAFGAMVPPARPPHAGPIAQPAPLVAAKFLTPAGVRVTAFPGTKLSRMYDTPVVMGLRPGYVYRFELANLPYNPGKSLYPEVEVRGMLVPRPGMKYMDYPIPLTFSAAEIERVLNGALITKVIYLEDPEKAVPTEVRPDQPVEMPEESERDALKNAIDNGRLMAIVRIGDRKPTPELLHTLAVDGTILLPGEGRLKAPMLPPVVPFWACPMYDPILGPKGPKEECFENGDDRNDPLGIGPNQRLGGLNPTDVGVEYTMNGKRRVTTSNVGCICAPRYMIRRTEILPGGIDARQMLIENVGRSSSAWLRERQMAMADIAREKANAFVGRSRPSAYIGKIGTSFFIGTSKPSAIGQIEGLKVVAALVEPEQLTAYPVLCPLTVTKLIDPAGPRQAGDVVTITIRFANTGTKAISDLVVSDSLSGRLEYVPGSAQTDRPGNFTTADNEAGSVIVRWDLPGVLLPGQAGMVRFKAMVR
jgi:uncharacterized repeat protein (TIGR01451 family)